MSDRRRSAKISNKDMAPRYSKREAEAWDRLITQVRSFAEDEGGDRIAFDEQQLTIGSTLIRFEVAANSKSFLDKLADKVSNEFGVHVTHKLMKGSNHLLPRPDFWDLHIRYSRLRYWTRLRFLCALVLIVCLLSFIIWSWQ